MPILEIKKKGRRYKPCNYWKPCNDCAKISICMNHHDSNVSGDKTLNTRTVRTIVEISATKHKVG